MKVNCFVENNPIVETLIQHLARSPQTFQPQIAAADEMFLYPFHELEERNSDGALVSYYSLGRTLFDSIQQIINVYFGSFEQISSFLDFACGYGRFMRFLVQEMPAPKIWASDIYADAVRFQTEYFGVNGIVSTLEPEDYQVQRKFDCIYAGSFFSHMPPRTFKAWMQQLYDLLNPEGLLIFSVLDEAILPAAIEMPSEGILFSSDSSESQFLDRNDYGTTYVKEAFIRELIQKVSQNKASIFRIPKGLSNYQDLYLVTPQQNRDFTRLNFKYYPEGYLDACNITPTGEIQLEGWAVDCCNPKGCVETIQIIVNNQVIQQCKPSQERPDLVEHFKTSQALNSGWIFSIDSGKISPQDIIIIKAVNTVGLEWIIAVEEVKNMMVRSRWRDDLLETQNQLKQRESKLQETQSQLELTEYTLAQARDKLTQLEAKLGHCQLELSSSQFLLEQSKNHIQAMESSKFWQLRTQWLKLKQTLGISPKN
ncbi:methyltransferase domain-containing protein [Limnoraphis robusta Tam1]|uniref:class I SAM-dependent methyltransferase n=1 Tax=Limnoraphis robusta TaxID=1118279 RepID=UPI002B1E96C5|nr:methyltransferase domain-containing protein [Limnoraphis robusta]MEA5542850.1 methyltransferase domain-containing protein [Limnoraphis robusta Tam1]